MPRVLIAGGGINGVMSAWALARAGHDVVLHERGTLMGATSSASTKLIHGGLRYLENREFLLVRESLLERHYWLTEAAHLVHPIELTLPIYREHRRGPALVKLGLSLYDWFAGKHGIKRHRWLSRDEVLTKTPGLREDGLRGAFRFYDAQMDDHALGLWAAEQAQAAGARIVKDSPILRVEESGRAETPGGWVEADWIVNATGPWTLDLMKRSGIPTTRKLDLVRGSHLLVDRPAPGGFFLQVPGETRVCFILPWKGQTMIGTTEVRQQLEDPIVCSPEEREYLLGVYNHYFQGSLCPEDVTGSFAGVRPLLDSGSDDPGRTTREYALDWHGRSLHVFGGKWTTARVLGHKVRDQIARQSRTSGASRVAQSKDGA